MDERTRRPRSEEPGPDDRAPSGPGPDDRAPSGPGPGPGLMSPGPVGVSPDQLRRALGSFATGVTVVTCLDGDRPRGVTVSAFMSVSLEPPLVLVALDQARTLGPVIRATGAYAVNILGEDDAALSDCFAGAAVEPGREAFCGAPWHPGALGLPILDSAIASLACVLEDVVPVGDHDFLVGRVVSTDPGDTDAFPLLYYRRRYLRIERATSSPLEGLADH